MKLRLDTKKNILLRLKLLDKRELNSFDVETKDLKLITHFIRNFKEINRQETSTYKQNTNFKLLMQSFEILEANISSNPADQEKEQIKKRRAKYYIFFAILLIIGAFFQILSAIGLTIGLTGLLSIFFPLFISGAIKMAIGTVISGLLIFLFVGGDYSSITRKNYVTFFPSGKILDSQINILVIINRILKLRVNNEKKQQIDKLTPLIYSTLNVIKEHKSETSRYETAYNFFNHLMRLVGGVFIVGVSLLTVKSGVFSALIFIGFSSNPVGIITGVAVILALIFYSSIYYFAQQKNVNTTVSKLFSRDNKKSNKIDKLYDRVTTLLNAIWPSTESTPRTVTRAASHPQTIPDYDALKVPFNKGHYYL